MPGTPSNVTSAAIGNGVNTATIANHTTEAGKALYIAFIFYTSGVGSTDDFATPVQFDGNDVDRRAVWTSIGGGNARIWIYSDPDPAIGTGDITFDGTAFAAGGWNGGVGCAFNIEDAPIDGTVILPGGWNSNPNVTSIERKVYCWGPTERLQISIGWAGTTGSPSITGGTEFENVGGACFNYELGNNEVLEYTIDRGISGPLTFFSFTIPDVSEEIDGGPIIPWLSGQTTPTSTSPSGEGLAGLPYMNSMGLPDTVGRRGNVLPTSGTLRSLAFASNVAPGAGRTIRLELYKGFASPGLLGTGIIHGIATGYFVDITDANYQNAPLDGINLPIYKYEQLSVKFTYIEGEGQITSIAFQGILFIENSPDDGHLYGGGMMNFASAAIDVEAPKAPLHPMNTNWGTFINSEWSLVGIPGNLEELFVGYQEELTGIEDGRIQYYIKLQHWNGTSYDAAVLQDGSGGSVNTEADLIGNTANRPYAKSEFTLPLVPGDKIQVVAIARVAPVPGFRHVPTVRFVPTVSGQFFFSGHAVQSLAAFAGLITSARGEVDGLVNENRYTLPIPPLTALGNDLKLTGIGFTPEGGDSNPTKFWTGTIRRNLADTTISVEGSLDSIFIDEGGEEEFTDGDLLTIGFTPTNSPLITREFWTIPGQSLAPDVGIIIIQKNAGGNTSEDFDFTVSGTLFPLSFTLSGGEEQVYSDVTAGNGYGFIETPPAGWEQVSVSVSNGSPIDNVSVEAGETVTIIFINAPIEPAENASGMYELIPGKTDDTIWIDASLGIEEDQAIP